MPVLRLDHAIAIAVITFIAGVMNGWAMRDSGVGDEGDMAWEWNCPYCGEKLLRNTKGDMICPKGHRR